MHPQLEHLAHQAHVSDLRREADLHRERTRLLGRGRRSAAASTTTLSPGIQRVLVFAEHQPTESQLQRALQQLQGLSGQVTALMHHAPVRDQLANGIVGNEAGSHSLTLPTSGPRIPAQRQPSEAEQHLEGVVGALRAAGHRTSGELVAGSVPRVLLSEVSDRQPEAIILLTDRHRFARLARRDLARQLRHRTSVPVIAVTEDKRPHLV